MPLDSSNAGGGGASLRAGRARRAFSAAELVFWAVVFGCVIAYAPWGVRLIGLAWAALAFAAPSWFLVSLAAAFPFFGNNPGGPHALYLIELGLMGFAARDLAERAAGARLIRPAALNPFLPLLLLFSAVALVPQHRTLLCEFRVNGARAFFNLYQHYATAPIFGLRMWLDLALALRLAAALRDRPLEISARLFFWRVLIAACSVAALLGLADYFRIFSLGFWRGENPDISRFGYRRLQSLFWHSGWFAQYVSAVAPAALAFALGGRGEGGARVFKKPVVFALAALLGLAQLLTFQRGGWIALAAASGAVLAAAFLAAGPSVNRRRFFWGSFAAAVFAAIVVLVLAAAIPALGERIAEIARFGDRSKIWRVGLELAMLEPWRGVGLGNYASWHMVCFPEGHENFHMDKVTPHNAYLYVFAERGFFALAAYCALIFGALAAAARSALAPSPGGEASGEIQGESLALFGGLCGLAANGVFQDLAYVRVIDLIFWIIFGLVLARLAAGREASPRPARRGAAWAWPIAGVLGVAVMLLNLTDQFGELQVLGDDQRAYRFAGARAEVPLPAGASRVKIPVLCIDPDVRNSPVAFAFDLGGQRLWTETFNIGGAREVVLDLPANRDPAAPLVIRASRTWSPYGYGLMRMPIYRLGVAWRAPEPANGAAAPGR